MNPNETHRIRAYRTHVQGIPPEKWTKKVRRFVLAVILLAAVVGAVLARLEVPWQVLAAGLVLGGYMISPDVMTAGLKFLVGAVKDLLAAAKNGQPAP